ncbi:WecB/TagA/CpsF family glycosyltransferase [Vagococcus xieshaowenii]|uniref:Glycosyltransferase n=1 Tax=Vagococcus xieshaowenii TaxID=2562451 RepID=A0AAJ5JLF9_9ENTE|nr:WecB/TagA/CpsF family glycosyltransferase [Vagococcus xieshaowenii]QCA29271.1 glycosyltransferase [Vagococcus xieshaowenii]TFZ39852.1 glycosyltransferase [Vagococcus xieshaowenii]
MTIEYINGLEVDAITLSEIVQSLPELDRQTGPFTFISVNPQIGLHAEDYPEIVTFINQATHRIPDGIGIVKVSQQQEKKIKERVAGIELMYELLKFADTHHKRIFLYGAKPDVLSQAVENIERNYPGLTVAGSIDGYTNMSEQDIVETINRSQTDMVFVALGFPRQELWLANHYQEVEAKYFQDVGGAFDVISGLVKRSPDIFIKLNLEWLYRSLSNPKRLYRIVELPLFVMKAKKWYKSNKGK